MHAARIFKLDHTFRCRVANYEEQRNNVLNGPIARKLSLTLHPKPLRNLNLEDFKREVIGRGLDPGKNGKIKVQSMLNEENEGSNTRPCLMLC